MSFTRKRGRRLLAITAAAAAPLLLATAVASAAQASPAVTATLPPAFSGIGQVIYDSTSPNVTASQGYQCCATGAWPGGGTNPNGKTYSNPRGFYWPLTLDLYATSSSTLSDINKPGTYPAAGTRIASVTQTVFIPWQPTPSTSSQCLKIDQADFSSNLQAWKSPSGCEFGGPADITFDLPHGGVTVPNGLVWGVAFDTESWGSNPVAYDGPFDSLNVAVTKSVRVGKDANPGGAFLDSTEANEYASCFTSANSLITDCPTGSFRNDPNGWTGYVPAAQFTASIPFP